MTAQLDIIPFVDVSVRPESLEDDLYAIVRILFPGARREDWSFEELQGGYINSIYRLTDLRTSAEKKSLVFKTFDLKFNIAGFARLYTRTESGKEAAKANCVNGEARSGIFSRRAEHLILCEVSKYGLCQPVYGRYQNGICYGYTEGVTLNGPLMLSDEYLEEAASKFAKFHSIKHEIPNLQFETSHDRISNETREIYYENLEKIGEQLACVQESPYSKMPRLKILIGYEKRIAETFKRIGLGRIAFCHCDLTQKNLIWNPRGVTGNKLGFIDLEWAMPNYVILDLGKNIGCFPGHLLDDFDEQFFPSTDYRRRFLNKYLRESHKADGVELGEEEFATELNDLFYRVSLAAVGHVLKWCIFVHVFDMNKDLYKVPKVIAACQEDRHFCAKHALRLYKTFSKLYPQVIEEAEQHFAKKPASSE